MKAAVLRSLTQSRRSLGSIECRKSVEARNLKSVDVHAKWLVLNVLDRPQMQLVRFVDAYMAEIGIRQIDVV